MIAISTGPETHLDHLAPLCAQLNIPLIVTNEEHLDLGKRFYPMIEINYVSFADLTLEKIATSYHTIVTCGKFWAMELKPLIKMLYNKELKFIFTPHGNSDKEALLGMPLEQDVHLSYKELGNIRFEFYKQHKSHFDQLAKEYFVSDKKTVLYAPTWETKATSTSFFESTGAIVDALASDYNLLIKLHPLLEENDPVRFHRIIGKYEGKASFILNFPAIYPLLDKTEIYLGDFSSVGYDFLTYNRPMFFLKQRGKLMECGEPFRGSVESKQEDLSAIREKTYNEIFKVAEGQIPLSKN